MVRDTQSSRRWPALRDGILAALANPGRRLIDMTVVTHQITTAVNLQNNLAQRDRRADQTYFRRLYVRSEGRAEVMGPRWIRG